MRVSTGTLAKALLPLGGALALAACGGAKDENTSYEADATDQGGGDLIVTDESTPAVPVEVPDTPMTPVPSDSASPMAGETPEG